MGAPWLYADDSELSECCGAPTIDLGWTVKCLECGDEQLTDAFWEHAAEVRKNEEADHAS